MNNKFWIGGLIGGVAFFLLGYVIYVLALGDTLDAHSMPGTARGEDEIQFLHIFLGNLAFGFLLSYIMSKAGTSGFTNGATTGLVTGLLMGLGFDLIMYGTTKIMNDMTGLLIDVVALTVLFAVVGGIIGAYRGMGRKTVSS